MTDSLRILTFNTQLRSWAMQVGASPGPTIPPVDTAEERAAMIGDAIVASPFDYDVVGLCEVFDEDARAILRRKLAARFPFQVTKADFDHLRVDNGTGSTENLGLLALWNLVGLPSAITIVDQIIETMRYRFEDSGLMLASRWPFVMMNTAPIDPLVLTALVQRGFFVRPTMPRVNFLPYVDTDGNDGGACKGILYMGVQRSPSQTYHFFLSHTQADAERTEEFRRARAKQLDMAEKFITVCTGRSLPFHEEVFFMGDLNVLGEQTNLSRAINEWKTYFGSGGRLLSDSAVDLWGSRQCIGAPGLRDPGPTATVRYAPQEQRLDYIIASATSALAAQHLMIDYDLAQVPPGHAGVSYLSDHRPLRLDLARLRANSTPNGALVPRTPPFPPMFTDIDQVLIEGQVKWYRFDLAGTYDFRLEQVTPKCGYEVYLDTDLSRPRQQYRKEVSRYLGAKYVLASAPFLVKVFPFSRTGEQRFSFSAHRHQGSGPDDAIQLPYGVPVEESFPGAGQVLNTNNPVTSWDDGDAKWFRLDAPQVALGRPLEVTITLEATSRWPTPPFSLTLAHHDAGVWTQVGHAGPSTAALSLTAHLGRGDVLFVQVQRLDGRTPRDLSFRLTAVTKLSLLLGGNRGAPRLICQKETSGWGADDIEIGITVDGTLLRYVNNDEIGDFEQDDVRDLGQWIPDLVPYFEGVEFKVVELDDMSPNDVGRETLPPFDQVGGYLGRHFQEHRIDNGTVRGSLLVDVDDGTYAVLVTITTWDEQF